MSKYQSLTELYGLERVRSVLDTVGVNYSTYHSWETGRRNPPEYVSILISMVISYCDMLSDCESCNKDLVDKIEAIDAKLDRAQDYLHDGRIREAITIIDNL